MTRDHASSFSSSELARLRWALTADVQESVQESFAFLVREGLVEWTGKYDNGQPLWALTAKGSSLLQALEDGDRETL